MLKALFEVVGLAFVLFWLFTGITDYFKVKKIKDDVYNGPTKGTGN